jgi:hypothetical protein
MATMTQPTSAATKGGKATIYKNFINGEWVESRTGRTFENLNPPGTVRVETIITSLCSEPGAPWADRVAAASIAIGGGRSSWRKWRVAGSGWKKTGLRISDLRCFSLG